MTVQAPFTANITITTYCNLLAEEKSMFCGPFTWAWAYCSGKITAVNVFMRRDFDDPWTTTSLEQHTPEYAFFIKSWKTSAVSTTIWMVKTHCFHKKLKNVSREYDRWVVETQLCKLRDTSDTLIGRSCAMFQLKYGVCEIHLRYGCWYSVPQVLW